MTNKKVPFSQNKRKTDIVAYLTPVGWLIAYFAGNRAESRFHLNQALSAMIAYIGLDIVFAGMTVAGIAEVAVLVRGVCSLLSFCTLVLWVMGFVRAVKGNETPIPVLGEVQILKKG